MYFRAHAESDDEVVDLSCVGVRFALAEDLVKVSDAEAREGCDCVVVRCNENGCARVGWV
jgi:hypothetical protein